MGYGIASLPGVPVSVSIIWFVVRRVFYIQRTQEESN